MLVDRPAQYCSATTGDPDNSTDVLCRARVQHPQAEHRLSFVGKCQDECRMLLLQNRSLRENQGFIRGNGQERRIGFLSAETHQSKVPHRM